MESTWQAIADYARWAASDFDGTGHDALVAMIKKDGWTTGADGVLRRQTKHDVVVLRLVEVLAQTNPAVYDRAIAAVSGDALFSPWLSGMVGTVLGATPFDAAAVVNGCVLAQLTSEGEFVPNEVKVRAKFEDICAFFASEETEATVLIPLPGLKVGDGSGGVDLTHSIYIGKLTHEEVELCADVGIIYPQFHRVPMLGPEYSQGCRIKVPLPIIRNAPGAIADWPNPSDRRRTFGELAWWAFDELVDDLLFVLRLVSDEQVVATGALLQCDSFGGRSTQYFLRHIRQHAQSSLVIDEAILARFREFWSALSDQAHARRLPRICIRRFNAAADRTNNEDAIADLSIAAEALFLNDQPSDRSELGYRLRIRAAKLLGTTGHAYTDALEVFKQVYSLRSTIVHGGSVRSTIRLRGADVELGAFVIEALKLLRKALGLAAIRYAQDNSFATTDYWEELLFAQPLIVEVGDGAKP